MEQLDLNENFECYGINFSFLVKILIDKKSNQIHFNFTCNNGLLPDAVKNFDVVTAFDRSILFSKLSSIKNEVEESVKACISEYIKKLQHPNLPNEVINE